MRIPVAVVGHAENRAELQAFAEAVHRVNVAMLGSRYFAPLYESGIFYKPETRGAPAPGVERFQTIASLYAVGSGDCDDLAPARSAEMVVREGRAAMPLVIGSNGRYHVVVAYRGDDGSLRIEDPSARLGMLEGAPYGPRGASNMESVGHIACVGRRHVAAVGFRCNGVTVAGIGDDDADDDTPEATRRSKRRALGRAFRNAAKRAAAAAKRYASFPATAARAAASSAANIAKEANRGASDAQTLDDLDVTDDAEASNGVGDIHDLLWELYSR